MSEVPNPLKAYVEKTGQEVLGILRFETITTDAGWKLDGKRKLYW